MKVSLSSTSLQSIEASNAIADLNPNAADLLITSVLSSMVSDLGVISPTSGALLTYYDGETNTPRTIDAYLVSPKEYGGEDKEQNKIAIAYGGYVETCTGVNTFAIPGIYKLLNYIYETKASLPIEVLFEYPVSIARKGFKLNETSKEYLGYTLDSLFSIHDESIKTLSIFKEKGLDNTEIKLNKLADTFEHMSKTGFEDFHSGDIANYLSKTISEEGGHATYEDFKNYEIIKDSIFNLKYKNLNIIGHKGPSIGGLMTLKYLNALSTNVTNLEEKLLNVYLERKNNFEIFENRSTLVQSEIDKLSTSPSTIHVSTSDSDNNHYSITFSSGYGSGVVCKRTGMFLNNSLGEIELNPQGFLGDTHGERLISNMSPLIVYDQKNYYVIGSPGADRISTALAQVINNYSINNDWNEAIQKPRFHVNADGAIRGEPNSIDQTDNVTITEPHDMYFGGVCVTGLNKEVITYGDKRRGDINWKN